MTQRPLILTQQTKWFEGKHVCHLCDARVRTRLPHKCRVTPVPSPPPPLKNFEHINFLKVGTATARRLTRGNEKFIFPVFRGEHMNFLARLTLGQPAVCPRAIWTLTRAKSLCLCAFLSPALFIGFSLHLP